MEQSATDEWSSFIRDYEAKRTNTVLPRPDPILRTTKADIWRLQTSYNPITQTFTDPSIENNVRAIEKQRLVESLAANKDRAIRYQSTYNIVNFQDKLKGLQDYPGYPHPKPPNLKRQGLRESKVQYNIISNHDFADHHYLPPEKRQPRKSQPPRTFKVLKRAYKDFDIITNHYMQDHEQKAKKAQEEARMEAARKYWATHDYDIIQGTFIQPEKEAEFQHSLSGSQKTHGSTYAQKFPDSIKYSQGFLYQPVNLKVVDSNKLHQNDLKIRKTKQRYQTRYDIERQYRERGVMEQDRSSNRAQNRLNHEKYVQTYSRGYNIINNIGYRGRGSADTHLPRTRPTPSLWSRTMSQSLSERSPSHSIRSSGFQIATQQYYYVKNSLVPIAGQIAKLAKSKAAMLMKIWIRWQIRIKEKRVQAFLKRVLKTIKVTYPEVALCLNMDFWDSRRPKESISLVLILQQLFIRPVLLQTSGAQIIHLKGSVYICLFVLWILWVFQQIAQTKTQIMKAAMFIIGIRPRRKLKKKEASMKKAFQSARRRVHQRSIQMAQKQFESSFQKFSSTTLLHLALNCLMVWLQRPMGSQEGRQTWVPLSFCLRYSKQVSAYED